MTKQLRLTMLLTWLVAFCLTGVFVASSAQAGGSEVAWPDYDKTVFRIDNNGNRVEYNYPYPAGPVPEYQTDRDRTMILLKRRLTSVEIVNDEPSVRIGVYRKGNTEGQDARFRIAGIQCESDGGAPGIRISFNARNSLDEAYENASGNMLKNRRAGAPATSVNITDDVCPSSGGTGSLQVTIPGSEPEVRYDPSIDYTFYPLQVYLTQLKDQAFWQGMGAGQQTAQSFGFKLINNSGNNQHNVDEFGLLGSSAAPIIVNRSGSDPWYFDYQIPLAPKPPNNVCATGSVYTKDGTFTIFDGDNFKRNSQWNGANSKTGDPYQKVAFRLNARGFGPRHPNDRTPEPGTIVSDNQFGEVRGWLESLSSARQTPSFSNSNQQASLIYNNMRSDRNYRFNILSVSSGNYISVQLPHDEIYGRVSVSQACSSDPSIEVSITPPPEFEKGSTSIPQFSVTIRAAGLTTCETRQYTLGIVPTAGISVSPTSIPVTLNGCTGQFQVGPATSPWVNMGSSSAPFTVALTAASLAWLNAQPPGTPFGISATMPADVGDTVGPVTSRVVAIPYFRAMGNDVVSCGSAASGKGRIVANSASSFFPSDFRGAATDLAAIATNVIPVNRGSGGGLTSAVLRATQPFPGVGLASQSSTGINCQLFDPAADLPSNLLPITTSSIDVATATGEGGVRSGDITVNSSISVGTKAFTVSATGNMYISSNITGNITPTDGPAIVLFAAGNIYIDRNVTELNAIIIAGGSIYTCATGLVLPVSNTNIDTQCNSKLVVRGALQAKDIYFSRTFGSRLLGAAGEVNPATAQAAEFIQFPGYLHFKQLNLTDTSAAGFDSFYEVAPRL